MDFRRDQQVAKRENGLGGTSRMKLTFLGVQLLRQGGNQSGRKDQKTTLQINVVRRRGEKNRAQQPENINVTRHFIIEPGGPNSAVGIGKSKETNQKKKKKEEGRPDD